MLITKLNHKIINWVQYLNRNRALTMPDNVPNEIEFRAVKARCLNSAFFSKSDSLSPFLLKVKQSI